MPRRPNIDRARDLRRNRTPPEAILWSRIRGRRLNGIKFRRQHPIGPYIADFLCPEAMLVIEVDGKVHRNSEVLQHDLKRDNYLQDQGYVVLRVAAAEVFADINRVLKRIDAAVLSRKSMS